MKAITQLISIASILFFLCVSNLHVKAQCQPPPPSGPGGAAGGGGGGGGGSDCSKPPGGPSGPGGSDDGGGGDGFGFDITNPSDPNAIISPTGFDSARWVSINDKMGFTILYENDPNMATAPAHDVFIYYPINEHQDMSTFRLGDFGFNQFVFNIPNNPPFYSTRLDLKDSLGLYVDVIAGIDVVNKRAFWIFQSIDPATGLSPVNPNLGFLPIKDSTLTAENDTVPADGEGFVSFTINPLSTSQTRDTIFATAQIVFDENDTIPTNTEFNTIDALPPVSSIAASAVVNDTVTLQINTTDDPNASGVKNYDLYVAQDSGNYAAYLTNVTSPTVTFTGTSGSQYHFFTLATDNTGNREVIKLSPDTSITFPFATITINTRNFLQGFYLGGGVMNPSIDTLFTNPDNCDLLILKLASELNPDSVPFQDTAIMNIHGYTTFRFPREITGKNFYLVLHHRNAIETWSAHAETIVDEMLYDFTPAVEKAYGNNQIEVGDGYFGFYSGDISDVAQGVGYQDGIIEAQDYLDMENAVSTILTGYKPQDITGDGVVEAADYLMMENNVSAIIFTMRP